MYVQCLLLQKQVQIGFDNKLIYKKNKKLIKKLGEKFLIFKKNIISKKKVGKSLKILTKNMKKSQWEKKLSKIYLGLKKDRQINNKQLESKVDIEYLCIPECLLCFQDLFFIQE